MNPNNKDVDRLDEVLKTALRREEPPPDFAERVMAKVSQTDSHTRQIKSPLWSAFSRPLVRWTAFAAVTASLVVGSIHYRNVQRERAEGEAAKQQLMLALHIAGSKLQLAKTKVNAIHTQRPEVKPETSGSRSKS
jgi:hypothetical protein